MFPSLETAARAISRMHPVSLFFFKPVCITLLRCMVFGCGIPFLFKQPVDILNTLCGRIAIIKLFSLGNCLDKISAQMSETAT